METRNETNTLILSNRPNISSDKVVNIDKYVDLVYCTVSPISMIMHTFALYLLFKLNNVKPNQRILLANLSLSEFLFALFMICKHAPGQIYINIFGRLEWFFYLVYLVSPLILTIDRLIGVTMPLRYKSICSKNATILAVASVWLCILIISIPIIFVNYEVEKKRKMPKTSLGLKLTVMVFAIAAYTCIGIKIHRQRNTCGIKRKSSKFLRIAILIVVTYLLFEVVPNIIYVVWKMAHPDEKTDVMRVTFVLITLNLLSDPIIYLYNYPPLKSAAKEKLQCIFKKCGSHKEESAEFSQTGSRKDESSELNQIALISVNSIVPINTNLPPSSGL